MKGLTQSYFLGKFSRTFECTCNSAINFEIIDLEGERERVEKREGEGTEASPEQRPIDVPNENRRINR